MLSRALWFSRALSNYIFIFFFLAVALACHKKFREPESVVRMGDPKVKQQILSGFYDVEGTGWRWAAEHFAVSLKPPAEASTKGLRLKLDLYLPDSQIETLGPMTLSATVNDDCPLKPETFSKSGGFTYTRDVPMSQAVANVIRVDFRFDKGKPPLGSESRELAAVVSAVSLETR